MTSAQRTSRSETAADTVTVCTYGPRTRLLFATKGHIRTVG